MSALLVIKLIFAAALFTAVEATTDHEPHEDLQVQAVLE